MFQETPIYSRLVAERGDIPQQVRADADRLLRDLEQVMRSPTASGLLSRPNLSDRTTPPATR
ncbi:hypothetical protein [Streptomyces sp. MMBL 11-3]|uniref:hypothetical protein n=1 Tax=Streptomyces sp. MMBL 11-3 TaxID=3382639 RepID=UPI0039B53BA8